MMIAGCNDGENFRLVNQKSFQIRSRKRNERKLRKNAVWEININAMQKLQK